MAVVRILVDGYSLLHNWQQVAPGKPRHSEAARVELIHRLTQYFDAAGTPVTVVFDGKGPTHEVEGEPSPEEVEVVYTRGGQTADQLIERVASRMKPYGEVLVVTDDFAERDTVEAVGGLISSCANFVQTIESTIADMERKIKSLNQRERSKFTTQ
jgi:predicted RNA-binding protein with PIN domain